MKAPSLARRLIALTLAVCLLALSATMAWATVADFSNRSTIASGVKVGSADVSGLTKEQAMEVIEREVATPLKTAVKVEADHEIFTLWPEEVVKVDVAGMADAALAIRGEAPFVQRLQHDYLGRPLTADVPVEYTVDEAATRAWLTQTAQKFDRPKKNAKIEVVGTSVKIQKAVTGRKLQVEQGTELVTAVLKDPSAARNVTLPVKMSKPKVGDKRFRKAIVVSLSQRKIRLYDQGALEKTYRCAIGTPSHPTPTGSFEIVAKRYMPTWVNPGSAWAKTMPPFIPPGPGNPLGTRALNLSASGIRFHGTENIGSVGTAASHGCMRMVRRDIEDLYERVYIGTKVFIVR